MNFKEWLVEKELLEYDYTYAIQAGMGAGTAEPPDPKYFQHMERFYRKIDAKIGMKKFFVSLPKFAGAQVLFTYSVMRFATNPTPVNLMKVLRRMTEASKMGVYTGATIPLGAIAGHAIAPGLGEVTGAALAKIISYGYFYMGQWADNNVNNKDENTANMAKKVLQLMPETMKHHDTHHTGPKSMMSRLSGVFGLS